MPLAAAPPYMASENVVYGLMTVAIVVGTAVLLAGVVLFSATDPNMMLVAVGGAVMVLGILAMAGYTQMLEEPEHAEAETGH